jgi:hypothetical protein
VLVRREPPRQWRLSLDHLEHRLLLAEQVLVRSGDDVDGALGADAGGLHLLYRARDTGDLAFEACLEADERLFGVDCEGGDDDALDELVRVGAQQCTVLERARLAFGPVGHGVARAGPTVGDRAPLDRSGEPRSAAPTQSSSADLADGLGRSDVARADQAGAAAVIEIRAE